MLLGLLLRVLALGVLQNAEDPCWGRGGGGGGGGGHPDKVCHDHGHKGFSMKASLYLPFQ